MVPLTLSRVLISALPRFIIPLAAFAFACNTAVSAQEPRSANAVSQASVPATVTLHWGTRPGVSRYRLQLANDASFKDIVFDRVVLGLEYLITELPAGKYFWRVAALGKSFNQSSSAGVIDLKPPLNYQTARPTPTIPNPNP